MKNKYEVVPQTATKKPAKAEISDAEFRRRLKNISEWRKKRLAQLHELLERVEDAEDMAWLKRARKKRLRYRALEEYLTQ